MTQKAAGCFAHLTALTGATWQVPRSSPSLPFARAAPKSKEHYALYLAEMQWSQRCLGGPSEAWRRRALLELLRALRVIAKPKVHASGVWKAGSGLHQKLRGIIDTHKDRSVQQNNLLPPHFTTSGGSFFTNLLPKACACGRRLGETVFGRGNIFFFAG